MLRRTISTASPLYVVMLGLLSALPPLGIDVGLPALPGLQANLGIDSAQATLTLTLFLVGFSLGPILFGPLSDRCGRKPVLLFGVAVFSLAALGCAMAPSIHVLLALRVIQGIGAGAASALPAAIVRDVFQGHMAISRQSYVTLVNAIAPLIAPLIGAALITFGTWRTIYTALAVIGGLLFLLAAIAYKETAPLPQETTPKDSAIGAALRAYRQALTHRDYLLATGLFAATFGVMFAYISSSSVVFMHLLGASATSYGFLFALTAIGEIAGAALNGRLAPRLGTRRLLSIGVFGCLAASAILLATACAGFQSIALCAGLVVASNFFAGIIIPNAVHWSLKELGAVAGSAAALQRSLQMITGACAAGIVGASGGNPIVGMALTMTLFSAIALGFLRMATCKNTKARHP